MFVGSDSAGELCAAHKVLDKTFLEQVEDRGWRLRRSLPPADSHREGMLLRHLPINSTNGKISDQHVLVNLEFKPECRFTTG